MIAIGGFYTCLVMTSDFMIRNTESKLILKSLHVIERIRVKYQALDIDHVFLKRPGW